MKTLNYLVLLATCCLCIGQMVYWFGRLPDIVPSHFDGRGNPDGEMGKTAFIALHASLHALFLIGFPLIGTLVRWIPDSMINLPNKEYWLAPQRRDETLATQSHFLMVFGWLSSCLIIGTFQLSGLVATGARNSIVPELYWLMLIYVILISLTIFLLIRTFRLPADASVEISKNHMSI